MRGVPRAAVPLVDAAPVGAQQAARDLGGLGGFQAGDRLELRAQRAVGEVFEQRGGRGRVPAGAGQDPAQVLDQVGAGPGALVLLGQRDGLLRRAAELELAGDRAARARVCAWRCRRRATPTARPTPGSRRACARACPPSPCAAPARSSAPCLALRVLKFDACARCASSRWDGLRPYCSSNRAARTRRSCGDRRAARGEHAHHLPGDAPDLEPVPVITRGPLQAEPARQRLLQVLGHDRGHRADMLVVAQRVRRPPFAVGCRPGGVGDLGVDVQLHVAVPGGVLQPVRHRQVRLAPLAGLPAVDSRAVGAGAGVAGLASGSSRTRRARRPRSCRRPRRPGRTSTHRRRGLLPGGPGGRSPPGRRGRSRCSWRTTGSGRRTGDPGGPGGWPGCGARACVRRWRAARRRAAPCIPPRPCGRWRAPGPAGCRRGPAACRREGHKVDAQSADLGRSRGPLRPGPTSGRAAPRRSRWPEGSSWPRLSPGRGPRASRCSPGHSLCSGSRQLPLGAAPRRRPAVSRAAHAHRMMHGCGARIDHSIKGDKTADQDQKREAY